MHPRRRKNAISGAFRRSISPQAAPGPGAPASRAPAICRNKFVESTRAARRGVAAVRRTLTGPVTSSSSSAREIFRFILKWTNVPGNLIDNNATMNLLLFVRLASEATVNNCRNHCNRSEEKPAGAAAAGNAKSWQFHMWRRPCGRAARVVSARFSLIFPVINLRSSSQECVGRGRISAAQVDAHFCSGIPLHAFAILLQPAFRKTLLLRS